MADPVLSIDSRGPSVAVTVRVEYVDTFVFYFDAGSAWAAKLLATRINELLGTEMQRARQEAYAEGWKHAKAKRGKETYFMRRLP